jgi:hypothetical protein
VGGSGLAGHASGRPRRRNARDADERRRLDLGPASTPTQEELAARHAAATAHLRELLCPELDDNDLVDGERF